MSADVGIKQAIGPTQYKAAPLKAATGEVIRDTEQSRWSTLLRALLQREYCQRGRTECH